MVQLNGTHCRKVNSTATGPMPGEVRYRQTQARKLKMQFVPASPSETGRNEFYVVFNGRRNANRGRFFTVRETELPDLLSLVPRPSSAKSQRRNSLTSGF
jgi:hypothetical protein